MRFSPAIAVSIFLAIGLAFPACAEPENGITYDPNLIISYDDWTAVLKETVWDTGPSSRTYAPRVRPTIGTRLSSASQSPTRLEANKVLFHSLSDGEKDVVSAIRRSLERLPDEMPLENLSPSEQLAYWLNLRNVAVFEALAEEWPLSNLRKWAANLDDSKILDVAGRAMSIRDIELLVMDQWPNPLVAYGFYLGNIGSPNLMTEAFNGDDVWPQLQANAKEFISSLRGVQFAGPVVKVSTFYERVAPLFPDFEVDLKAHLLEFAKPSMQARLYPATEFKAVVEDWGIADLYNGKIYSAGASNATNPAAFILAMGKNPLANKARVDAVLRGLPAHAQVFAKEIAMRNYLRDRNREGIISIEEVDPEKD